MHRMENNAKEANKERMEAQSSIKYLKDRVNDKMLTEDIRHNYIYNQMINNANERGMLVEKRTEVLPEITTMPRIDKVQFELPVKPSDRYDDKHPLPSRIKYLNYEGKDDINKITTSVNMFDADYLN
mmetsp:Transcript_40316/g.38787  ORF Transcript_40316/g.38787 Transcript_40316/m.38787 type:complete len:127 (+) Transcript_40316:1042-1422(+)